FERESVPAEHRIPVNEAMLGDMEPHLIRAETADVVAPVQAENVDEEGWAPLPPPTDDEPAVQEATETYSPTPAGTSMEDERAQLEAELARLDADRTHRMTHTPAPTSNGADTALADLESRLSDVEF
ncbi:MAG: hypothetical protein VXW90_00070, partial [Candidatus Thermoplasmatota archaeon]|nr:hypothetical protein [Candidatus Thermoplasmatota archaeon]MEC7065259.1 hypothetical protein [Candidatus Thermoplasmatota archaeon]